MTLSKYLKTSVCAMGLMTGLLLSACGSEATGQSTPNAQGKASTTQAGVDQRSADIRTLTELAGATNHAYEITRDLTTEIGPRLAGSEAEARARDWAVARFKALGLQNVRVEPFDVPGWVRGVETAHIISPSPQQLYITSLGGSVGTAPEGVTAEIAYYPTFEALESSPLDDLGGKIVFISGLMEKAHDGAGYGPANRKRRSGATEAAKRGASAVLIRSVGTDSHRFPHTGQMNYAEDVKRIPIAAMSGPDADQMERLLESGQTMTLEMVLTPQHVGDLPSGNVIGEIIGSEKPDEIIVVGGHLDSWDLGTGAIDDGAGIGISAGAAKVILDSGLRPKRTIRVIAFGAEEIGLKGGKAYAERHKNELDKHILASESDFGAGPVYELQSGLPNKNESFMRLMEKELSFLSIPFNPAKTTNGGPDIGAMSDMGVPTVRLQQDGFDYFDLHHTPDDTIDKVDPEDMKQNTMAWVTMIWLASETDIDFRK